LTDGLLFGTLYSVLQKTILISVLLSALSFPSFVRGEESPPKPTPSAESILKASLKRIYSVKDQTADVSFRVVDEKGTEKKTLFKLYWKNYSGKDNINSKALLVTESPSHDKGQKFLIWEYVEEDKADLWLYLPELRQVRRVQPGRHHHEDEPESDLLFEDMHQRRIETDDHLLLPEEEVRGEACYVIENKLKGKGLYSKTITYISKNDGTIRKIDYFSPEGPLLKTQWIDWQQIDQNFVWKTSQIFNAQTPRKTFVEVTNVKINVNLSDDQFSERALRK
jgi:outer membrane lipoprotein-sorting protein